MELGGETFSPERRGQKPAWRGALTPLLEQAEVSMPPLRPGQPPWFGKLDELPARETLLRRPLLVFLHGSSGLNEQTRQFQCWLSRELGLATLAPDSFAQPERPRYRSPASTHAYEAVHRLRLAEIHDTLAALPQLPWVDQKNLFLAGSSEGAVAAARWRGREFRGRLIYSWPCEDNYFVERADNGFEPDCPILNILSSNDPYFGAGSVLNQGLPVLGHSRLAFREATRAQLMMLPEAPHTLYNQPAAHMHTRLFLSALLAESGRAV